MENYLIEYDYSLLPPHVTAQILNNLKCRQILTASQTCKSWHFASCDPMITKRLRVRIRNQFDRLEQLSRPFGALVLSDTNFNEFEYKDFFAKFGKSIIEIEFINCILSTKQLADCLIFLTNLSTFKIIPYMDTFSGVASLLDSEIEAISQVLHHISHFSVLQPNSKCDGLEFIMSMMPNLKVLCFGPFPDDTQEPFKDLVSYTNMFKLEELGIQNLSRISTANFIRDFSQITTKLNLNSLSLSSLYSDILRIRYYDENFAIFCQKLANLKILSMHSIGEHQLNDICRYMTQLIELNLFGITTKKIHVIGHLRNLQKLSLKHFNQLVEEDQAIIFASLGKLNDLEVDYEISDKVLNEICTNCKNLTRLDLSRMKTNNLEILFKNLVQLKHLDLLFSGLNNLSHIDHDITSLQLLEHLNINVLVPGITIELIEKLPNLRKSSLQDLKYKFEVSMRRTPMLSGIRGISDL